MPSLTPISQHLHSLYLKPVQDILERKARYWGVLADKDPFTISEQERLQNSRRMEDLQKEVEAIDRLCHATENVFVALEEEYQQRISLAIEQAKHDYHQLALDYVTLQGLYDFTTEAEKLFLAILTKKPNERN